MHSLFREYLDMRIVGLSRDVDSSPINGSSEPSLALEARREAEASKAYYVMEEMFIWVHGQWPRILPTWLPDHSFRRNNLKNWVVTLVFHLEQLNDQGLAPRDLQGYGLFFMEFVQSISESEAANPPKSKSCLGIESMTSYRQRAIIQVARSHARKLHPQRTE